MSRSAPLQLTLLLAFWMLVTVGCLRARESSPRSPAEEIPSSPGDGGGIPDGAIAPPDGDAGLEWSHVTGHFFTVRYAPDGGVLSRRVESSPPVAFWIDGGEHLPLEITSDGGTFTFMFPKGTNYWIATTAGYVQSAASDLDLDQHVLGDAPKIKEVQVEAAVDFQGTFEQTHLYEWVPVFVPSVGELGRISWPTPDGGATYFSETGIHPFDGSDGNVAYVSKLEQRSPPMSYAARGAAAATLNARLTDAGFTLKSSLEASPQVTLSGSISVDSFTEMTPLVHPQASESYGPYVDGYAVVSDGTRWIDHPKGLPLLYGASFTGSLSGWTYNDGLPSEWARVLSGLMGFSVPVQTPGVKTGTTVYSGTFVRMGGSLDVHAIVDPPGPIQVDPVVGPNGHGARLVWNRPAHARSFSIVFRRVEPSGSLSYTSGHEVYTEGTRLDLPEGTLKPDGWYIFIVTARTYGPESENDAFAPFSIPLEYGFATSVSDPVSTF